LKRLQGTQLVPGLL